MKLQISRIQQQFKEEKQGMEANFRRTMTNLESEINIKEGSFKELNEQLKHLSEENTRIEC